jgi:hypothetical protein
VDEVFCFCVFCKSESPCRSDHTFWQGLCVL